MAKIHGFGGVLKIADTDPVGELQGWNLDPQANTSSAWAMGQEWEDTKATVKKWSGSAEAYFDPSDAGQIQLEPGDRVQLHFYPDGDSAGKHYRSGYAVISGTPISASKDGWVSITFNFVGDGALTSGTAT